MHPDSQLRGTKGIINVNQTTRLTIAASPSQDFKPGHYPSATIIDGAVLSPFRRFVMNKDQVTALAEAAGLEKVLDEFPEDVAAAVAQAVNTAGAIRYPVDPAVEPWPPMRAGIGS
jgi:hypothetical protein